MTHPRIKQLQSIDWEFSDYRGFSSFPADINSIHWYPAPFVPQIPAILIQALTEKNYVILDPFAGTGVALIEAVRLKRIPIGVDVNPYAVNIVKAKFIALDIAGNQWFSRIENDVRSLPKLELDTGQYCKLYGVSDEALRWFEESTLNKLCTLHRYVSKEHDKKGQLLMKVLFSAILQKCCSQREHYTYITDGCFPEKPSISIDATELFLEQAKLIALAAENFRKQYTLMYSEDWKSPVDVIHLGDARDMSFLKNGSIDMIVTSPPYLGVNDYIKSLRLTWLFFPENSKEMGWKNEIGARSKRHRSNAFKEYIDDMEKVFFEISRVLKRSGFLCLTIGQGQGKVNKGNVKEKMLEILQNRYGFRAEAIFSRRIKFKRIQIVGVRNEEIVILSREPR
jgi:DNA modification methylase